MSSNTLHIHEPVMTQLGDLVPADYNPRTIDESGRGRLRRSLKSFGLVENLVANRRTGNMVGGHQRLQQIIDMFDGDLSAEIPVVWLDISLEEEQALNLTLNNEFGQFDLPKVGEILGALENSGVDGILAKTSFSTSKVSEILDGMHKPKPLNGKPDPVDALRDVPEKFELGMTERIGDHVIGCIDSTQPDPIIGLIGEKSASVVFLDPPYMAGYTREKSRQGEWKGDSVDGERINRRKLGQIMNDNLEEPAWNDLMDGMLSVALRVLKKDGVIFFCIGPPSIEPALACWNRNKLHRSAMIVWDKKSIRPGRQDYRPQYEFMLYGWPKKRKHRPGRSRSESDLWSIATDANSEYVHPSQKPVQLYSRILRNATLRGELVVDLCCGSGGMLLAAEALNRRAAVFDMDPRYCDVTRERLIRSRDNDGSGKGESHN